MTNLEAQVIAVLSRSAMLPASALSGDKRLADLGIGSLEQIECILALEDEFKVEFPDTNLQKMETVQDLVDFVRRAAAATAWKDQFLRETAFSSVDAAFRLEVRGFVERELAPHAVQWERARRFPRSAIVECGKRGYLGLDRWKAAVFAEELARCESMGVGLNVLVQARLIGPLLEELGTTRQRARYSTPLRAGRLVGAMAVSEPSAGSDFVSLETRAMPVRGGFSLSGEKTYITNAAASDFLIVAARTAEGSGELTLLVVPSDAPGSNQAAAVAGTQHDSDGAYHVSQVPSDTHECARRDGRRVRVRPGRAQPRAAVRRTRRRRLGRTRTGEDSRVPANASRVRPHFESVSGDSASDGRPRHGARGGPAAQLRHVCALGRGSGRHAGDRDGQVVQLSGGAARDRGLPAVAWRTRLPRGSLDEPVVSRARALTIAAGTPEVMRELIAAHLRL